MKALFNRLIKDGYATYFELQRCTMRDVFNMMHLLEWNDHALAYADVLRKANS